MTKDESRSNTLVKNTGIYAIGTFGSRLLMFLLVPIYSFYISPAEYGYFDICLNIVILLGPILSFQYRDGALRFLLDAKSEESIQSVIGPIVRRLLINTLVFATFCLAISIIHPVKYLWLTALFGISFAWYEVSLQICRGLSKNVAYAAAGIFNSLIICTLSIILVVVFKVGIEGVFIGNIAGRVLGLLYIDRRTKFLSTGLRSMKYPHREISKALNKYCLPMLMVNILIWIMSSSNRLYIQHFLGLDENGIFAVAQKFSAIFETIAFVIFQAWQEMAMKHYNDADRNIFFSKIFHSYTWVLTSGVIILSFGIKLFYPFIIGPEYQESADYVYFFLVLGLLTYLAFFFDVGYQCARETHRSFYSLIATTILVLLGNWIAIPLFGLYGALACSCFTYLCLTVFRAIDTRRYFRISLSARTIFILALMLLCIYPYYACNSTLTLSIAVVVVSILCLLLMPGSMLMFVKQKLHMAT